MYAKGHFAASEFQSVKYGDLVLHRQIATWDLKLTWVGPRNLAVEEMPGTDVSKNGPFLTRLIPAIRIPMSRLDSE